jgi:hypothetical protein
VDETRAILGLNAAELYGFDVAELEPLAARVGPTPADLGQGGDDLDKWLPLETDGRPWLSGIEALPVTVEA